MADFDSFLPRLLRFEGGFVSNTADPGGATNKGITLQTWRECSLELLRLAPSLDNLRALTDAQAGVIYKRRYWDAMRGDKIAHQGVAELLVDFNVNAGSHAVVALQGVLNAIAGTSLTADGVLGDATFAALSRSDASTLLVGLREARIAYYMRLAAAQPTLKPFLKGWLNRANAFSEKP